MGKLRQGQISVACPKVTQLAGAGIQIQAKSLQSQHLTYQALNLMNLPSHPSSLLTKEKCGHWAEVARGVVEWVSGWSFTGAEAELEFLLQLYLG